jgi:hypothetical protein
MARLSISQGLSENDVPKYGKDQSVARHHADPIALGLNPEPSLAAARRGPDFGTPLASRLAQT